MKKNQWIKIIGVLIGIFIVVWLMLNWMESQRPKNEKVAQTFDQSIIQQGEYLVKAADCASCHTTSDGALFAGGYELDTQFGKIFSSNITPSLDYGIGRWTADQFYRSITRGVSPIHKNVYPAMPYPYFINITKADSDAMYAYFMSIPAIDVAPPENQLSFPYNERELLIGWNELYLDETPLPAVSHGSSDQWKRGEYLVNVLGHCAMCHTPLGEFGNVERDKMFQGNTTGRFSAPNITPEGLSYRGWDQKSLEKFFKEGIAPQGSAFSDMYLVIHNSTSQLTDQDVSAIVTYLLGEQPPHARIINTESIELEGAGYDTYLTMCSGCHNLDGTGKPNVAVPLVGNSTVMNPDSHNLIVSILDGLPWQTFPNDERLQAMPSFSEELTNEDIAELVNFLRREWGGLSGEVTAEDVNQLRL